MTGKVIEFRPKEGEKDKPSLAGQARCLACKHEWVSVVEGADSYQGSLECPECGVCRGQFKWPFQGPTSERVWTCNCDGQLFMITEQGTRCVGCGRHQVFDG
jgi:hypothetical protein